MTKITTGKFQGVDAVTLTTAAVRLVAVSQYGPRIASFGLVDGPNLFLWKPGKYRRGQWDLRGGHRVWVTRPGADENEDTYATDNDRCEVEVFEDGFRLTGAENPVNRTRRGFAVRVLEDGLLEVENFVHNTSDMLYSGGIWALTCTVPAKGTRYAVPLGDGSEWDAFRMVCFRRWAGHGEGGFADTQMRFLPDLLVIEPRGLENKRMIESHHGIIAMSDPARAVTFAKKVPHDVSAPCPLGCNLAFYIGPKNFMVEMESMGPERTLRPGETLRHVERWVLRRGAVRLRRAADVTQLFAGG